MLDHKVDALFELIRSLSAAEKRSFRLYAGRLKGNEGAKFMKLFDIMGKMRGYDEKHILKKAPVSKIQLANMKAHLYKQILVSLRLQHVEQNRYLQIRECFDFARILYNKGLYVQSIKSLEKAKFMAREHRLNIVLLELLDFEKMIESQHITRSLYPRAEALANEAKGLIKNVQCHQSLSDLSLSLYGLYLRMGHVRNVQDRVFVERYFRENLPKADPEKLDFFERLSLYQARLWYYYILQDFVMCYRASRKWVDLFEYRPEVKKSALSSYLKGYHYLLDTLFYLNRYAAFLEALERFEIVFKDNQLVSDDNTAMLVFMYRYTNRIHRHFMEGTFSEGVRMALPGLFEELKKFHSRLDQHHIMLLYYKIACLYFGSGNYEASIHYLLKIMEEQRKGLRQDLQCFARLLHLIACYEAGLDERLGSQIKSVYKFFVQMDYWTGVQQAIVDFLKNLGRLYPHQVKGQFRELKARLMPYSDHPYEKRTFLYLDIISWLSSKIENKPVEVIIREKFLKQERCMKEGI
ncbi:MAG: hypothetical protein ACMUEL_08210 [Flavobacteriales bacterium Tduv]